jgi:hypothetical protein
MYTTDNIFVGIVYILYNMARVLPFSLYIMPLLGLPVLLCVVKYREKHLYVP